MNERRKQYPFDSIEAAWQRRWEEASTFHVANPGEPGFDTSRPKFYALDMFPYPSGEGLHVGHPEGYTATDILSRYKRMCGFNVLHPMGWDAFGLPAEQHAIKTGEHPSINTLKNIDNFRSQLKALGLSYDWQREISTTDPGYVRWTQWIFLQLYNSWFDPEANAARPVSELEARGWNRDAIDAVRLAYVAEVAVNWSPDLGTVLANEEVEEWKAKGHTVERRPLRQWMLRITAYAQRLMDELEPLDWPESIKLLQRNWIGRSEGALVRFQVADSEKQIEVFTTRPDTLFGATYMVLAPEHPLVAEISSEAQASAVQAYQKACTSKSDLERGDLNKDKTGVFTGAHAINPVNGESIPVWIADYVMMGYGTGAIMAVPAHDERDFEFATRFELPIRQVVAPADPATDWHGFTGDGTAVQSGFLDGLQTPQAKQGILTWLEDNGKGSRRVQFKLRDWLFSRQRYWGEPFPVIWREGRHEALPERELPLLAPHLDDYKPTGQPEPLLSKARDWVELPDGTIRETNTMPQWAGSCWYYLRYCDAGNTGRFLSKEAEAYWMRGGVDLYVGGTEHAVLHLLYARFWHKVLFDLGHVGTREPFQRLVNQGMILGEDGQKMSKSRGNVINPDTVVSEYGADALRLYEMFMGPLEQTKPWSMSGVEGVYRFLARVWRLFMLEAQDGSWILNPALAEIPPNSQQLRVLHSAIKKVTEDIEGLRFNTAISEMMVFVNAFTNAETRPVEPLRVLLQLLNPLAPHLTEELNRLLEEKFPPASGPGELAYRPWPKYDEALLIDNDIEVVVQVNGKLRDKITVLRDIDKEALEKIALTTPKIVETLSGLTIRKVVVVPGKLVNIVAN